MPRKPATRARIEQFLAELGRLYKGAGRVYLVGGTVMVLQGYRTQTQDVDYTARIAPQDDQDFVQAIVRLKRQLDLNIEEASPGHFIPLPAGWEARSPFLGRYGQLEVFTFDPISTCLSKIARGTGPDIDDVLALVQAGKVNRDGLIAAFQEIMPRLERESVRVDEVDFRRKFDAFLALLADRG
ncbi:MAG TPA: DUF6036 family nucleotidyltransferase [Chloroflexota bacterium]|nr:DUF6036 family nucleotidyltransferase [Chloroflexota bacterium]